MKKKQNIFSWFSTLHHKTAVIMLIMLLTLSLMSGLFLLFLKSMQASRTRELEKNAVSATESLMEMTIENSIAIAKTIYMNESLYDFLDTEYQSSADYFNAYYKLSQNNPLNIAEANTIRSYTIYTRNSTIMSGNGFKKLQQSVMSEDWYLSFMRLNKSLFLWCDSSTGTLSLIRKLDYHSMSNGEAFLKLDLNLSLFQSYCRALDFNGELYIVSGGAVFYTNQSGLTAEQLEITHDFSGFTKNYYTLDINYYAQAENVPFSTLLNENKVLCFIIGSIILFFQTVLVLFLRNNRIRIAQATEAYRKEGNFSSLRDKATGTDEIGELISDSVLLSEKFLHKNLQYHHSKEELSAQKENFRKLYESVLISDARYDALRQKIPFPDTAFRTLKEELEQISGLSGIVFYHDIPEPIITDLQIPSCALVRITAQLLAENDSFRAEYIQQHISLTWQSGSVPDSAVLLRLRAIFEEGDVCENYPFEEGSPYNPYLQLAHAFGSQILLNLSTEENFTLHFTLQTEPEDS